MNTDRPKFRVLLLLIGFSLTARGEGQAPLAQFRGSDFSGGAKGVYGSLYEGENANWVYARPTGAHATMGATFTPERVPEYPPFLHLKARDDDSPRECRVEISLNGHPLLEGPNGFSGREWRTRKIPIPEGVLRTGTNELSVSNLEETGILGMPPWFMVAWCMIGPEETEWKIDIRDDFFVILPDTERPIPEPLPEGEEPGFAIRGTKGWKWTPEQYLSEIPILARFKMNFLMNCYTSLWDLENHSWGDPLSNRWWEPLPEETSRAYEEIVKTCREHEIHFCFSMNPNLFSGRPLEYDSSEDMEALWQHYEWMQSLGVKWFNLSLDDISVGVDASGQSLVANRLFQRLREKDPDAELIFTPSYYWGDGTDPHVRPYLETLASELDEDILLFWTGDEVVGPASRGAADGYRSASGHRLFLWDNYPVNDNNPTMHLGPLVGRDPALCEVVEGYMSNAMCTQHLGNRIPLLTCADYAYNPRMYDPHRSIGQAILHLAKTDEQREVLKDLVEAYPGMLLYGENTGFNPVRERFAQLSLLPHPRFALEAYVTALRVLSFRFSEAFPNTYGPEKETLLRDVRWIGQAMTARYGKP